MKKTRLILDIISFALIVICAVMHIFKLAFPPMLALIALFVICWSFTASSIIASKLSKKNDKAIAGNIIVAILTFIFPIWQAYQFLF